jgi:ATP-dependent 26S proteasome regulatory subunit
MLEQLQLLIQSGHPILSIETHDEPRAAEIVRGAAAALSLPVFEWSITSGLVQTRPHTADTDAKPGKAAPALEYVLKQRKERAVYLFKDLAPHARDPYIARLLRDLHSGDGATLVLVDLAALPDNVRRLTVPLQLKLPDCEELEQIVRDTFRQARGQSFYEITHSLTKRDLDQLVQTLRGLTCSEAARVVAAAIHDDNALTAEDLPRVVEGKRNLLQATGCLESISVDVALDEMGGMDNLKRWLCKRREGMSARAREFGLAPPRGILLLGVQGCGKSLCAKAVASGWGMPLLRMDPGVLYQKFIGETENRLREALQQAETMAPAVLWIDEIEKAFASATSASADGGLSQRMFGTLLSWMQDHQSPIFMVATANNIAALPPELMRKGRFDEVFFVDLPSDEARRQILSIHLQRRKREPKQFPLEELVAATAGFSGAEIEQAVVSAMFSAFSERGELNADHLLTELRATRPLSVLMAEQVAELRGWARDRCVSAN